MVRWDVHLTAWNIPGIQANRLKLLRWITDTHETLL